ncbi:TPA: hypothetical protein ACQUHO_004448 [Bacillus cereus]|nr:hypothetical protein [Bacillus thuringiensis]
MKGEMIMQAVLNATDVRKNWSEFIDGVVQQNKPQFVSRNNKEPFLSLNIHQAKMVFSTYTFTLKYVLEDDDSITAELKDFDLFVNSESKEAAIRDLAIELIEYAQDYSDNIQLYYNAPNRREHFPFIMNVLLQDDLDGVISLIHADI